MIWGLVAIVTGYTSLTSFFSLLEVWEVWWWWLWWGRGLYAEVCALATSPLYFPWCACARLTRLRLRGMRGERKMTGMLFYFFFSSFPPTLEHRNSPHTHWRDEEPGNRHSALTHSARENSPWCETCPRAVCWLEQLRASRVHAVSELVFLSHWKRTN